MREPVKYIVNTKGEKVAAVLGIKVFRRLIHKLEDYEDLCAILKAMESGEKAIPFEQARARNRHGKRKPRR